MKIRAMVEVEVTLTDEEWKKIKKGYRSLWREQIKAGEVPKKPCAEDAWHQMLDDGGPPDMSYDIAWDICGDMAFPSEDDQDC